MGSSPAVRLGATGGRSTVSGVGPAYPARAARQNASASACLSSFR